MKRLTYTFVLLLFYVFAHSQEVMSKYYGIFTDNPNILVRLPIDDIRGHVYIWEGTLTGIITEPYEGEGCLAFRSTGVGWWGFGVHDDSAASLTNFNNGFLIFSAKTSAKDEFSVHVYGANHTEAKITFVANGGPQNFKRDGIWHKIVIPLSDLVAQGLDLTSVSIPFAAIGGNISNIAFDDIFYSLDSIGPENPLVHPQPKPNEPTDVSILGSKTSITCSNGILKISGAKAIEKVIITDITGKTILKSQLLQSTYIFDVSNWPKGLYFITTYSNTQKPITQKVVIH